MGFLSIERKFYDNGLTATALTAPTDATGGEFDPSATMMMTTPAQGDGPSNRDGKEIAMLYLQINGTIALPSKEIKQMHPMGAVYLWLSY